VNGCSANVQNPHYSASAGGIVVKTVDTCTYGPTEVVRDVGAQGLYLWLCPSAGQKSEVWITTNCSADGWVNYTNCYLAVGGDSCTRTAPTPGVPPAHGTGYWVACETFSSNGPNGQSQNHTYFSNFVFATG
jgi:hypothetical protein